jgi:ABC-type sulfate/molybdate transport systems ATPase subunit
MVFQSYALYPHMSVRKNIESPLVAGRGARIDAAERDQRVAEAETKACPFCMEANALGATKCRACGSSI